VTYSNDPDPRPSSFETDMMAWLLGGVAIFAVLGVIIYVMSEPGIQTASTGDRPAVTTGSGATTPAPQPAPAPTRQTPAR
jgi:hypothetical protein